MTDIKSNFPDLQSRQWWHVQKGVSPRILPIRRCRTILEWVHGLNIQVSKSFRSLSLGWWRFHIPSVPDMLCVYMCIWFMYPSNTRPSTSTIKTLRNAFILNCSSQFMMHDKWHKLFLIFLLKEVKSQTSSMHVSILTACEPLLKIICLPRKTRSYLSKLCACRPIMSIVFCFWTSDLEPSENNIYIYM